MDASNWINLGLLVLTAAGLVATIIQAVAARRARDEATESSISAECHEKKALAASQRSAAASEAAVAEHRRVATALERQASLAEKQAKRQDPWTLTALGDESMDQLWRVTNSTGENVQHVSISTPAGFEENWIKPAAEFWDEVANGDSIEFTFVRRLSSPNTRTIWVFWTPADGSKQKQFTRSIP
ncbi:hypothetical protein [Rhodoglobus aureus]|uniref:Uncharacterized protein n=1 Tax=Rhodoglobus aureus TaxID=191497 RepID=A0ABP4GKT5_9MICO